MESREAESGLGATSPIKTPEKDTNSVERKGEGHFTNGRMSETGFSRNGMSPMKTDPMPESWTPNPFPIKARPIRSKDAFDENTLKGELVVIKGGTKVILEGCPGSGTVALSQPLNIQNNSASFIINEMCEGGVVAVGVKTLKYEKDGWKVFSRNYFWRYKATHAEVRSAIDWKWMPYGLECTVGRLY